MICRNCNKELKHFKNTKYYERYKCVNKKCKLFRKYIYSAIHFEFPKSTIKKYLPKLIIPKGLKIKTIGWYKCK